MEKGVQQTLGWAGIVLAILVALTQGMAWAGSLQYLWAVLVLALGIWTLAAK